MRTSLSENDLKEPAAEVAADLECLAPGTDEICKSKGVHFPPAIDRYHSEGTVPRENLGLFRQGGERHITTNPTAKRFGQSDHGENIPGAQHISQRAPNLNIRAFRAIMRHTRSQRARRREARAREVRDEIARETQQGETGHSSRRNDEVAVDQSQVRAQQSSRENGHSTRFPIFQTLVRTFTSTDNFIVSATAVEEEEVFEAEKVRFWNRNMKALVFSLSCMTALVGVFLVAFLVEFTGNAGNKESIIVTVAESMPSESPSAPPSSAPTYDPRSTLDIVRSQGYFRCGVPGSQVLHDFDPETGELEGYAVDMCRFFSAVIFGHVNGYKTTIMSSLESFAGLHNREIDLLLTAEVRTIEREITEDTTGVGFSFSFPYYFENMIFVGNKTFVDCANNRTRYGECSTLSICVLRGATYVSKIRSMFPSKFLRDEPTFFDLVNLLINDTCNVIVAGKAQILFSPLLAMLRTGKFFATDETLSKAPLAAITRQDDKQWSDIINWSLETMMLASRQGLMKNMSLCLNDTTRYSNGLDLRFLRGVYCVGSFSEFMSKYNIPVTVSPNNGEGLMFSLPFGDLHPVRDHSLGPNENSTFGQIINNGTLTCGLTVPNDYSGEVSDSQGLVGMSVDYCRALAAAIFQGDRDAVHFILLPESDDSSVMALINGTVDVLAGSRVSLRYDIKNFSLVGGVSFSTPYYYEERTDDKPSCEYALATREDDSLLSTFVDAIIQATIYAVENRISKKTSEEMPLISLFGPDLKWSLRDAVSYSGNYDEIFRGNFESIYGEELEDLRGRNKINAGAISPPAQSILDEDFLQDL